MGVWGGGGVEVVVVVVVVGVVVVWKPPNINDKILQVVNRGHEARIRGRELEALNHLGEAVALARSIINKETRATTNISSGLQISSKHLWNPVLKKPSFRGKSKKHLKQ